MATVTANTYIGPQDGWVQISATAATYIRTSAYPHTHQYQVYFGSSAPSLAPVQGSGTVTFSTGVPVAGQTTTIGTEVYTWRAAAALPFEVTIGADDTAAATNFTAAVNSFSTIVTASRSTLVVTLTSKLAGQQFNYAIATTAAHTAVSGATLTGGLDIVQGITVCHKPFLMVATATSQPMFVRVPNPVPNSNRSDGRLRLDSLVII